MQAILINKGTNTLHKNREVSEGINNVICGVSGALTCVALMAQTRTPSLGEWSDGLSNRPVLQHSNAYIKRRTCW